MAEKPAEDDDDEGFGDFKFVPSSNSNQNNREHDDEWGDFIDNFSQKQDFIETPLQFQTSNGFIGSQNLRGSSETQQNFDPFGFFSDHSTKPPESQLIHVESEMNSVSPADEKRWEKPRGALPLSIFGDEEEESDSVNTSFDDAQNMFSSKPAVTVKNGLSFGSGIGLNDLIVNLYSQAEQIRTENGSNSDLVDENRDFDEDGWEFQDAFSETRGGDSDSGVEKDEKVSALSGIQVEVPTTNNSEIQVDGKTCENSGAIIMSEFSNGGQHCGDWFVASDGFSYKPTKIENGFDFKSGVTTVNGCTSDSFSHSKQIGTKNGLNSYLVDENFNPDENFCEFKDALSETGVINGFSGQKEEHKVADHSGVEVKVHTFDGENQGNEKGLENYREALPLSIFTNGELDSDDSLFSFKHTTSVRNGINSQGFSSNVSINDLISNLYDQVEQIPAVGSTQKPTENGFNSAWTGLHSDLVNGEDDFEESSWEFKDASTETRHEEQSSLHGLRDINQNFPTESKLKSFVDFYSRLKEDLCFVALHHLDGLKKAQKVAALSGEDAKAAALHEEIQVVYKKLHQENVVSEEVYSEERPPRNVCVNELLEIMKESQLEALESEYHLSKRVSLAEKDLSSAIALLEHAISMVKILTLGSMEDHSSYITTWSKMISACTQELKHGSLIWKQSLQKNVHRQILSKSQGQRYVIALGEIYRVVAVLRVSATLYKPWILSSLASPMDIFALLEECDVVWLHSGLEEALQSISDTVESAYEGDIKALLESIKSVHDLDALTLQNHVFALQEPICRLSVLSLGMVPDMKAVVWNGERYFLTLANLWANRISFDPPKLPHIYVG